MLAAIRSAAAPAFIARRAFASTPYAAKTISETVNEVAGNVNKAAGDVLKKGIELGESASETVKANAKPLADAAKNLSADASKETQKKGLDAQAGVEKLASDAKAGLKKAQTEVEAESKKL